jgi:hypothetical protein
LVQSVCAKDIEAKRLQADIIIRETAMSKREAVVLAQVKEIKKRMVDVMDREATLSKRQTDIENREVQSEAEQKSGQDRRSSWESRLLAKEALLDNRERQMQESAANFHNVLQGFVQASSKSQ